MENVTRFEQQVELEKEMQKAGYDRYMREVAAARERGEEAVTAPVLGIVKRGVDPVAEALAKRMEDATTSGKAGRRATALRFLEGMDLHVVAFIAIRTIFNVIHKDMTLQMVALTIGRMLETEAHLIQLEEKDNNRFKATHRHIKRSRRKDLRSRREVFNHAVKESEHVDYNAWGTTNRFMVGSYLIDLVAEVSGLFKVVSRYHKSSKGQDGKMYYIQATDECLEWIDARNERIALVSPAYSPCVIEPKPWTGIWEGGYHTDAVRQPSLIKSYEKAYLQEVDEIIKSGGMVEVIDAINAMQNTAWQVNTRVLDIMREVFEMQGSSSIAGLPAQERQEVPPCPVCGASLINTNKRHNPHQCFINNDEAYMTWKKNAAIIHSNNASLFSNQIQYRRMIEIANRYKEFPEIYFPYQMDFRGRVYTIPSGLTPQGTKASKGLLHFAEGKAIGTEEALRWFLIHGANTHGEDKIPFDERVAWVLAHEDRILSCAADPIADMWWADADSPWCFLAWCFEYAGYKAEGLNFKSRIPIAMDGSCNGIQIFSLILRDPEGAKAVNVLPSDKPQDVYAVVAERTTEKLKQKLIDGEVEVRRKIKKEYEDEPAVLYNEREEARKWLDLGVTRKTTKRQVMVLPYGGTSQSCRDYTQEFLNDKIKDGYQWEGNTFMSSVFLANLIWDSINETVSAPQEAMRYLQKVSSIVTSEGLPTNWTTPCGLPVMQRYRSLENVRVRTKMGDSVIKITVADPTEDIDASRQRSAISPNYVHSLDAAALQRTVYRMVHEYGIKSLSMIHDSYGTHAADTPALARTLREVFVDMFGGEKNLLKEFTDEVTSVIHDPKKLETLPELPELGSLEVDKILESEFFFA